MSDVYPKRDYLIPRENPDERWQCARALAQMGRELPPDIDPYTEAAFRFLNRAAHAPQSDEGEIDQAVEAAQGIWSADGPTAWRAEAMLIAGFPLERIAAELGVDPQTVEALHRLFFEWRLPMDAEELLCKTIDLQAYYGEPEAELPHRNIWIFATWVAGPHALKELADEYRDMRGAQGSLHKCWAEKIRALVRLFELSFEQPVLITEQFDLLDKLDPRIYPRMVQANPTIKLKRDAFQLAAGRALPVRMR